MGDRLSELLAKKAELEQEIVDLQREERASAIAQIRSLMSQYGLTLADIGPRGTSAQTSKPRSSAKVPAKYRDPATGQTWSGRGLHPKWLRAALEGGARLEDFTL